MKFFLLTISLFSMATRAEDNAEKGLLSLYRWNLGYRADSVRAAKIEINEEKFREILAGAPAPQEIEKDVYAGCYLASYKAPSRGLASIGTPSSEIHRICWPRNKK